MQDGICKPRVKLDTKRIAYASGLHEPIAEPEVWLHAQDSITRLTTPTNQQTDLVNVFSGIIKCKKCGKAIHVHNPKTRPMSYLYCSTKDCDTKMINIDKVEHMHLEQILERIQLHEQDYNLAQGTQDQEAVIAKIHEIEREIEANGDRRNNLHDLLESGVYTKVVFLERMHTFQERGQEYERNLKKLRNQLRRIEGRAKLKEKKTTGK